MRGLLPQTIGNSRAGPCRTACALRGSGLRKVKDGVTTLEEVLRETVK